MADQSSNQFWANTDNYKPFELRAHRFRPEMRPVFFTWLGITPDSKVLDGGCGTGVFTRYLAAGLAGGHITGFDISKAFIEYGTQKTNELALQDKMTLEVGDGFNLHYPDNTFDAVTNYTYIGVLSDPEAGLRELARVCKPGGVVSCVVATNSLPKAHWQGEYPFDPEGELQRLATWENRIFSAINEGYQSPTNNELSLLRKIGLEELHIYPFAHLICYSDTNYPLEYRRELAIGETQGEIDWLKSRYASNQADYTQQGFRQKDLDRLIALLELKLNHLRENFGTDDSCEWHGGYNYIVTAKKPLKAK